MLGNRVAISGASGFIGKAMAQRLTEEGLFVIPIDRKLLVSWKRLRLFFDSNMADSIIHMAAYGNHYDQKSVDETVRANVIGTANILLSSNGLQLYNISSSSVTLKHKTPYSVTKSCGEQIAALFPNAVNIRPYSVYGPGEASFRFIPTVIRALHTQETITLDETATHDWIYIDDFITAFLNGHTEIGSGIKHSNLQAINILEQISGKKLNYIPGKLRSYDTEDWVCKDGVPHRDLEEGLLKTYLHYSK